MSRLPVHTTRKQRVKYIHLRIKPAFGSSICTTCSRGIVSGSAPVTNSFPTTEEEQVLLDPASVAAWADNNPSVSVLFSVLRETDTDVPNSVDSSQ